MMDWLGIHQKVKPLRVRLPKGHTLCRRKNMFLKCRALSLDWVELLPTAQNSHPEPASADRWLMPFFQKLPRRQPKLWKTRKVVPPPFLPSKITQLNYSWKMKETCLFPEESGTTSPAYQGNAQTTRIKEICGWGHCWYFALILPQIAQAWLNIQWDMVEKSLNTSLQLSH